MAGMIGYNEEIYTAPQNVNHCVGMDLNDSRNSNRGFQYDSNRIDELTFFGEYIAAKLRTMNNDMRNTVKKEMVKIVANAEKTGTFYPYNLWRGRQLPENLLYHRQIAPGMLGSSFVDYPPVSFRNAARMVPKFPSSPPTLHHWNNRSASSSMHYYGNVQEVPRGEMNTIITTEFYQATNGVERGFADSTTGNFRR